MEENIIGTIVDGLYEVPDWSGNSFVSLIFNYGSDVVLILKLIEFLIVVAFVVMLVVIRRRTIAAQKALAIATEPAAMPPPPRDALAARWQEIQKHINSHHETEWKFAVIEADKMIEDVLRESGYEGASLGERLM